MDILNLIVRAERSAERSEPKIGWSGAGGRGAGTERRAGVTGIGWSVERLFRPLRSAHMLWVIATTAESFVTDV